VVRVADEILRNGTVRRAWTGLEVAGPTAMQDWKRQGGVTVLRVAPEGPAARAGITEGAVLLEANGRRLRNYLDWEAVKLDLHVGNSVTLRVRQRGRDDSRTLVTGDLPTATAAKVTVLRGIEAVTVTEAIQTERGLRSSRGALILRISAEVARLTGLAEGDVILGINRTPVTGATQLADLLESLDRGQLFRIWLERGGAFVSTDLVFR
jgi:S1-C subfamily serine protease